MTTKNRFWGDPLRVLHQRRGGVELVYADDYDKLVEAAKKVVKTSASLGASDEELHRHYNAVSELSKLV
jgi:hypothetical protein